MTIWFFEVFKGKILWFFPKLNDWKYKIVEVKKIRSPEQNRLYWWYILKFIVLEYQKVGTIHTKDFIHESFKKAFLPRERVYSHFSKKYILQSWSTTTLNKKQFTDFIENIKLICEFGKLWEIKGLEELEAFVIPNISEEELLERIDKIV